MARLQDRYRSELLPRLKESLGRSNPHAIPKLEKIVVSMGVGSARGDAKIIDQCVDSLTLITGQKAHRTRARKSVANFKLREGMVVGARVTLRGKRMYEFLDRLISLALPRVRDFRGVSPKSFDRNGNYSFGLTEQMVFPEIDPDKITHVHGMNITIVTTADNDDDARALLREFGMPFKKDSAK